MSNSDQTVSPSQLATYVECPRKYEYEHDQNISSPPDGERYKNRGIAYHEVIAEVCEVTGVEDTVEIIVDRARELFAEVWAETCSPADYKTRSHFEYDRKLTREGILAYFQTGPGVKHARHSCATELNVETEYKRTVVSGRIDNVVKSDDGLLLIDYKGNLNNIISSRTAGHLSKHLDGEVYRPKIVESAIQAAVYLEAIRETSMFEKGMNVSFVYYGILHDHEVLSNEDGIVPQVSGKRRDVSSICLDNHGTIWQLIRESYQGIRTWDFAPNPWPEIYQSACDECPYNEMCPDFLGEEVKIQ